jgi:hypothetical protein
MVLPMDVSQQSPGDGSLWCNTKLGEDLRTLFPFKQMLLGCGLIGLVAAGNIFSAPQTRWSLYALETLQLFCLEEI